MWGVYHVGRKSATGAGLRLGNLVRSDSVCRVSAVSVSCAGKQNGETVSPPCLTSNAEEDRMVAATVSSRCSSFRVFDIIGK